jgi:phosphate acyltransferase
LTYSASDRHSRADGRAAGPGAVRIAVDLLGGDQAPAVVVDGALQACGADPDLSLLLVGTRVATDEAEGVLGVEFGARIATLVVERGVRMSDPVAHGADPQTSIGAAAHILAAGGADAVVSAGASGATVAAAVLALGRVSGVRRPALAAILPGAQGALVLLDVGAGLQASPADLVQHAVLGSEYARTAAAIAHPRVGLMSIGSEYGKGDDLRRAADAALRLHELPGASYVGPVEGHDVVSAARVDVVVTDGFTGNVLLKGVEAALAALPTRPAVPAHATALPRAAALLGVAGIVVVCHGAANGHDIASGVALAAQLVRGEAAVRPTTDGLHPVAHQQSGDHDPASLAEVHP